MLKATSFISPTVFPLSLDPLRIIQSVPFTHHTQTLCQLVPHAKQFVFPMLIKNLRQSLVQLAEVIPTSSGRSSYPPSALTRGRLAHFVHLRSYGSLHAPTLHYAISQPSWLHLVFSNAGSRQFSLFYFPLTINLSNYQYSQSSFSFQHPVQG